MNLAHLDGELLAARAATEEPSLPDDVWPRLATTIHEEIAALDERVANQLRL